MTATDLLDSWLLSLAAERKSPATLKAYGDGVRSYIDWCARNAEPDDLSRKTVVRWIADLLADGSSPSTATARQLAVRRMSAWAADEGEIERDDLLGLKRPKIDVPVIQPLTDDDINRMLAAPLCKGAGFRQVRNTALLRFMAETGLRAGEAVSLTVTDVDLRRGVALVKRGKGGKGRLVPFSPTTASAIDRYLRRGRKGHRLADTSDALWLGDRGKAWTYYALHKELSRVAAAAGVTGFHPHRLRHTAAHRWLAAGGSEAGLMAVAGWQRPDMLLRYTRAQAGERAIVESRGLELGEFG